ncbi:peptidoglycan D,D-transpeptidase FtsI family protein [Guptibacillus algicola]|uniref:peptidoglycan D,D-transpeptidase FtsI family protein n=1 Tax=Guptibacillus algicola TaxID=225844 RepID=UPI001CD20597|nr:penicillin-binding transpeptidase domain-containing protein [Alkalihalobacillus algicola]MCA0986153.1 penicillin-binding protein 2 [Alkalihalobacillus algicola]
MLLIGRLIQIQLVDTDSFSNHEVNLVEASINQRTQSFILSDGRGTLVDRNGEPMRGSIPSLILFPFLNEREWPIHKVSEIINVTPDELRRALQGKKQPFKFGKTITKNEMVKINDLRIPGVYAVYQPESSDRLASHLIGSVRTNPDLVKSKYPEKWNEGLVDQHTRLGISGLQLAFDPFLISEGESKLLYHADRKGNPLLGLDVKMFTNSDSFYPLQVKTTVDTDLQGVVESSLDQTNITDGGAVLIDIKNSNVLSMASRPTFDENNPLGDGATNKMVKGYFPGSVFKTVILAAAYEAGIPNNRTFDCNQNVYRDGPEKRELGVLDLKQSFAASCNATFAILAEELIKKDQDVIEKTAEKLGISSTVGWNDKLYHYDHFEQFPDESDPVFFKSEKDKGIRKAIDQTAIGQLNVKVSPLSLANMMATIARGGDSKQVRVVSDILYQNNTTFLSFQEKKNNSKPLPSDVVDELQGALREVVASGTGKSFLGNLPVEVAGKSGTAEPGGNADYDYQWFVGYFPYNEPRYALAVVDFERREKEYKAYQAFAKIVDALY